MSNGVTEYTVPTTSSQPEGLITGPDGLLWFTESASGKIGKVTTSGTFTEYSLGAGHMPQEICVGPDGNLWFTDHNSSIFPPTSYIGKSTTGGSITEYA